MRIVEATEEYTNEWAELRALLWPEESLAEHVDELRRIFFSGHGGRAAFIAIAADGSLSGFAEAGIRRDPVEGCLTSPAVYLEGIFVRENDRGTGLGRRLAEEVQSWGQAQGCSEFASDAMLDNVESRRFHAAIGFAEAAEIVAFCKSIPDAGD